MLSFYLNALWIFSLIFLVGIVHASTPYWTAELDNGLRVILVEDHSTALVASVVCIRAGSRTETPVNNGLSHLLEHMLFDGTERLSREELARAVNSRGGYFNAFTRKDYVVFEMVMSPADIFTGMKLQADQVLHSTIPADELAKEKKVVCEEIAKDMYDAYSAADDEIMKRLFSGTGYGLPVIGNFSTVQSISREAVLNFYHTRYVPNRMTLIVIGDFSVPQMFQNVRELYGPIPEGLNPRGVSGAPAYPEDDSVQIIPRPVDSEYMLMAIPAPPATDPMAPAAALGVSIWCDSGNSSLKRAVTQGEHPLALSVDAWITEHNGFSLLNIGIRPAPDTGKTPQELADSIQAAVSADLKQFSESTVEQEKLDRSRMSFAVDRRFSEEKYVFRARDIAHHDALGAFDAYVMYPERLQRITSVQIRDAMRLFARSPLCSVYVVPEKSGEMKNSTDDNPWEPAMKEMENGLKVILWPDSSASLLACHLLVPVPGLPDSGVQKIVSGLLDKGTSTMDEQAISDALADYGIRLKITDNPYMPFDNYYNSPEYSYIRMECLSEYGTQALALMKEIAFDSTLPEDAFHQRVRVLAGLAARRKSKPSDIAGDILESLMFPDSLFSRPELPDPAQLKEIHPEQARAFYHAAYVPSNCILSIVGGMDRNRMWDAVQDVFGALPRVQRPAIAGMTPAEVPVRKLVSVNSSGAFIRAAVPVRIDPKDRAALAVAMQILSSKMADLIRETKGMAYRLGASVSFRRRNAVIGAAVGTRAENTRVVEADLRSLIRELRQGKYTESRVKSVVNQLLGHANRYRQRRINRAYYLAWRTFLGWGYQGDAEYLDQLWNVTLDSVQQAVKKYVPVADKWFWVIAAPGAEKNRSLNEN